MPLKAGKERSVAAFRAGARLDAHAAAKLTTGEH